MLTMLTIFCSYSERKLFTGFVSAALMAWKLMVSRVMIIAAMPDATKTPRPIPIR